MQDIYKDLNDEQRRAVLHDTGPLLIIAGAGTGKTTVITRRIASLIEKGVEPSSILALTFTEKAAAEMEERVDRIVPYGLSNVAISTFHSFGDRALRDNALSLGLVPDYKLLTESESVIFLKEHLFDLPLDLFRPKGDPAKYLSALIKFIGRLKDEDITPEDFLSHVEVLKKNGPAKDEDEAAYKDLVRERTELAETYARYAELMAEKGYLDFGDLVVLTLKLFRLRPNVLKRYRERFSYILADEFQDTNYSQFELLKTLAGGTANLTVVADDDQSIYKFRGAAVSNVLNFLKAYPEAANVTLKKNYRSVQPILDAAYRLICNNNPDRLEVKSGIDKKLEAAVAPGDGGTARYGVKHIHFDSLINEAEFVAEHIAKRVEGEEGEGGKGEEPNGARFRDFAVLVRARSDAEPFLRALEARGVPYHFSGNSGLYSREEIVLLVCFLKCITNFTDSVSLAHLAGSIIYGLPAPDLVPCNDFARRTHTPLLYVMKRVASGEVPPKIVKVSDEGLVKIKRIVADIERFSQMAIEEPVGRVLYAFLTDSGYIGKLLEEGSERAEDEVRNISRFFEITRHMEETLSIRKASTLVENLKLLMDAGENPGMAEPDLDDDAVQVLTVHKAKGLEFPTVFMVGLVSERFPRRARKDLLEPPEELIKDILPAGDHHLQEERRLFYVGMTRAQETLYLTGSADCGGVRRKKMSRFVVEAMDEPHAAKPPVQKTGAAGIMETIGRPAAARGAGGAGVQGEMRAEVEELTLSFYKIDDYLTCPLKYRFAHVLNIPLLPHHTIIYGKAVHDAISYYFKNRLDGKEITLEDFLDAFKRGWKSEGFLSKEHELARLSSGIESLKRFYERAADIKPSAVEKDFSIDVGGVRVRGRWDLIVERADGPFVVDFKTSEITEQKKADKKAKESDQLKLYALAYREAFGRMPAGCGLHFVESGLVGSVVPGDKDIEKISEKVASVAEGLKRRDFTARPNYLNCGWCAFNNICPDKEKKAGGLSK